MKIRLEKSEAEQYFYNALCNALGELAYYGLVIEFDKKAYKEAKESLKNKEANTCFEDVLMELLRMGGTITMIDEEGDGEMTKSITIQDVHEKVAKTPLNHLVNMIQENDDATTGDVILQTVFFDEIVFG
jgi:hypothetical protein